MRVSGEGQAISWLVLCLAISPQSRVEPRMDTETRPLDKRDCVQLNSLGLYLGCADPTLQEELVPLNARLLGPAIYLESHEPHI